MNNDIVPSRSNDTDHQPINDEPVSQSREDEGYRPQTPNHFSEPEKKKRGKAAPVLTVLLLLTLLGAITLAYLWLQERAEAQNARDALTAAQEENSALKATEPAKEDTATSQGATPLTQQEQVLLEASTYYCQIEGFGCDKVNAAVSKIQEYQLEPNRSGFATVKAGSSNGSTTNLFLKSTDGIQWAVIYEGQNTPPQAVVDRFAIPEDFLATQ